MNSGIRKAFSKFPKESDIVGRILAAFAGLEYNLMQSVYVAHGDFDEIFKDMYAGRSMLKRIKVAEAKGRPPYKRAGLESEFDISLEAFKHCRDIRNQYAHCHWHVYDQSLTALEFIDLETLAKSTNKLPDLRGVPVRRVSKALLIDQHNYFDYTSTLLISIMTQFNYKHGKIQKNILVPMPNPLAKPDLHLP